MIVLRLDHKELTKEGNTMDYQIEITRNNVTLAQFMASVKHACKQKGIPFDIDRDMFEHPDNEYSQSYTVIDGVQKCHYSEYRTVTGYRRKIASYTTSEGFTRYYYTDEIEEYQERKLCSWDDIHPAEDAGAKAEAYRQFAYDYQTYVLNWDGSMYNEICEFTFDDEKRGHGYYYQVNRDAEVLTA
jgi:hypothetical protein